MSSGTPLLEQAAPVAEQAKTDLTALADMFDCVVDDNRRLRAENEALRKAAAPAAGVDGPAVIVGSVAALLALGWAMSYLTGLGTDALTPRLAAFWVSGVIFGASSYLVRRAFGGG